MENDVDYTTWPSEAVLVDNSDYPQASHVNTLRNAVNYSPSENLIKNSIFRVNTTNWTLNSNAARETSLGGYPVGFASILDDNVSDTYVCYQELAVGGAEAILNVGNTVVVSAYVQGSIGSNTIYLVAGNQTSGAVTSPITAISTTYHPGDGAFHRLYTVFVVPTGATGITIQLNKSAATSNVYVTGFQLESGSIPTGFKERIPGDGTGRIIGNDIITNPTLNGNLTTAGNATVGGTLGVTGLLNSPNYYSDAANIAIRTTTTSGTIFCQGPSGGNFGNFQCDPTSGILFNKIPTLISGNQTTTPGTFANSASVGGAYYGSQSTYGCKLTNIPSSFTFSGGSTSGISTGPYVDTTAPELYGFDYSVQVVAGGGNCYAKDVLVTTVGN